MPNSYEFIPRLAVEELHHLQILRYGGSSGLREENLLESALARPENTLYYEPDSSVFKLAAVYLHGLVKNHAFVDGNKRIAFVVATSFLVVNGHRLFAKESEAYQAVIAAATDQMTVEELADWLEANSKPV